MKINIPDLPDMLEAGMGLTQALAFWSRMMNAPDRGERDWWREMRAEANRTSSRTLLQ